jgi:hypothetical protein
VVLAVVLLGGARLIYLSVQHHAAAAHAQAAAAAATYVRKIEPELKKLADLAAQQAAAAADAPDAGVRAQWVDSIPPASRTFWMSGDDQVIAAPSADLPTANGVASEWRAAESTRASAAASALGPIRLGSEWLIAIRVPVRPQSDPQIWSVAFMNLDELWTQVHLERLINAGYDFELSQIEPRSLRSRTFFGSATDPLQDPVASRIALPAGTAAAIPGSYLQVAVRPRAGWYPPAELASDIGLLVFLAWLIAFGTHELSHEAQSAREAVTSAQQRLRAVNQLLASEMQQRVTLQETFDHARFHDAFTGLPNRRYFMDQLDRALRDVRTKRRRRIAVILADISRFKLVNDMLGHTAGTS